MQTALVTINASLPSCDVSRAAGYAVQDKAESTRRAYKGDWRAFQAFCDSRSVPSLPASAESVAAFLAHEADAGLSASTIGRRCAAIRYAHKLAGYEPSTNSEIVKSTLRGIRRTIGAAPKKKAPAVASVTRDMAGVTKADIKGLRDRALLLMGFGGAFRRSELVALDVTDLEETDDGLRVTIRRSKTDQEGHGVTIAVVRGGTCCPVTALRAWLEAAAITEGPVFRQVRRGGHVTGKRLAPAAVCDIVKACAGRLGLDPKAYGAHSLRSGAITTAAKRGASIFRIKDLSRHKSTDVLAGYVREAELFKDHCLQGAL
jgi:integrase